MRQSVATAFAVALVVIAWGTSEAQNVECTCAPPREVVGAWWSERFPAAGLTGVCSTDGGYNLRINEIEALLAPIVDPAAKGSCRAVMLARNVRDLPEMYSPGNTHPCTITPGTAFGPAKPMCRNQTTLPYDIVPCAMGAREAIAAGRVPLADRATFASFVEEATALKSLPAPPPWQQECVQMALPPGAPIDPSRYNPFHCGEAPPGVAWWPAGVGLHALGIRGSGSTDDGGYLPVAGAYAAADRVLDYLPPEGARACRVAIANAVGICRPSNGSFAPACGAGTAARACIAALGAPDVPPLLNVLAGNLASIVEYLPPLEDAPGCIPFDPPGSDPPRGIVAAPTPGCTAACLPVNASWWSDAFGRAGVCPVAGRAPDARAAVASIELLGRVLDPIPRAIRGGCAALVAAGAIRSAWAAPCDPSDARSEALSAICIASVAVANVADWDGGIGNSPAAVCRALPGPWTDRVVDALKAFVEKSPFLDTELSSTCAALNYPDPFPSRFLRRYVESEIYVHRSMIQMDTKACPSDARVYYATVMGGGAWVRIDANVTMGLIRWRPPFPPGSSVERAIVVQACAEQTALSVALYAKLLFVSEAAIQVLDYDRSAIAYNAGVDYHATLVGTLLPREVPKGRPFQCHDMFDDGFADFCEKDAEGRLVVHSPGFIAEGEVITLRRGGAAYTFVARTVTPVRTGSVDLSAEEIAVGGAVRATFRPAIEFERVARAEVSARIASVDWDVEPAEGRLVLERAADRSAAFVAVGAGPCNVTAVARDAAGAAIATGSASVSVGEFGRRSIAILPSVSDTPASGTIVFSTHPLNASAAHVWSVGVVDGSSGTVTFGLTTFWVDPSRNTLPSIAVDASRLDPRNRYSIVAHREPSGFDTYDLPPPPPAVERAFPASSIRTSPVAGAPETVFRTVGDAGFLRMWLERDDGARIHAVPDPSEDGAFTWSAPVGAWSPVFEWGAQYARFGREVRFPRISYHVFDRMSTTSAAFERAWQEVLLLDSSAAPEEVASVTASLRMGIVAGGDAGTISAALVRLSAIVSSPVAREALMLTAETALYGTKTPAFDLADLALGTIARQAAALASPGAGRELRYLAAVRIASLADSPAVLASASVPVGGSEVRLPSTMGTAFSAYAQLRVAAVEATAGSIPAPGNGGPIAVSPAVAVEVADSSGTPVAVRNLTDGVRIRIPTSVPGARCAWLDAVAGRWSADGCTDGAYDGFVRECVCTHLTTFALVAEPTTPTAVPTPSAAPTASPLPTPSPSPSPSAVPSPSPSPSPSSGLSLPADWPLYLAAGASGVILLAAAAIAGACLLRRRHAHGSVSGARYEKVPTRVV